MKAVMKAKLRAAYKAAVKTHNLQVNCLQLFIQAQYPLINN